MHCNIILFWEDYLCSSNWSLAGLSLRFQVGLIRQEIDRVSCS